MATLADLRLDIRSRVDELTANFYTDADIDRWANESLRDVARRGEVLQAIKVYDIIGNQVSYDAPADMIRIYRAEYHQSSSYTIPLEYQPLASMDDIWYTSRTVPGSIPYYWSWWGFPSDQDRSQVYLYPVPSANLAQGLWLFYYRLPRKMTNATDPADIPAGWEDLVPLYAEVVCRRKDNDRRWQEAQELYEAKLQHLFEVSRQPTDQMTFISGNANGVGRLPGWLTGMSDW